MATRKAYDVRTLRYVARRMLKTVVTREQLFRHPSAEVYGRLSEAREWASVFASQARAITAKARRPKLTPATTLCGPIPKAKR